MFSFLHHRQDFYRTWLLVTRWVSYKIHELLTLREHLGSPLDFDGTCTTNLFSFCILGSMLPMLLYCPLLLPMFLYCPLLLPMFLYCPLLIAPLVFSNVYSNHFPSRNIKIAMTQETYFLNYKSNLNTKLDIYVLLRTLPVWRYHVKYY